MEADGNHGCAVAFGNDLRGGLLVYTVKWKGQQNVLAVKHSKQQKEDKEPCREGKIVAC